MTRSSESRPLQKIPVFGDVWQRIEALPKPVPEDSLLLRIGVQAMVIVGIIATDVAAEFATPISIWAVPMSIVGATWSWYRRRERNVTVKFLLAILMLGALALFFRNLFTQLNDTRLVLAELLIQLQVLHSFDLPRRQDLGYSMVIGLILIGVAATLSQTLVFAPLLLLFLAIALPTLVLDYRSRLGLAPLVGGGTSRKGQKSTAGLLTLYQTLSPKRLGVIMLVALGLGMAIFVSLPRFPGYQLRTLPVSAPMDMTAQSQKFQRQPGNISNPGYVRQPNEGSGEAGSEDRRGAGAGQMDEEFYYGFNTEINQNLRGQLEPKVVMRVRSQAAGFWRALAFDEYTGQGWEIERAETNSVLSRPFWSYKFDLYRQPTLARTREVIQTYTVVSPLPNIIPALTQPKELYFPTEEIAIDTEDSLRSPLELLEGLTYTVVSEVPYRDRTILRQASTRYSETMRKHYLQVPPEILDRVRQRTEELLATSPNPLDSAYEQALYLTQQLKQRYTLQPELPFFEMNEDLVTAFLFNYQGGYPDHFSTALTIMLRSIGIPARLAVGFAPGEFNPFTGLYIVRNTDAYAVTEVYFPQYGWFAFDPIPGHELYPPTIEDYESFGVLKQFWNWVAGWLPSPVRHWLGIIVNAVAVTLARALGWLWRVITNGWIGFFTGLILAIATAFIGWLGWQQWLNWRRMRRLAKLPPMERFYQQMLGVMKQRGFGKHPAQTPLEYVQVSRTHQSLESATAIAEISEAYVRWRYGGEDVNLEQVKQQLERLLKDSQPLRQLQKNRR